MTWQRDAEQGNEAGKIKHRVVPFLRGTGLDLGCGPWPVWPHVIGVDNFDEWTDIKWQPDVVADVTDLQMFADMSMDFVFSSHLLEHLDDPEKVLREWWRVLKVGGHMVLYLPHKNLYPNIGESGSNPDHKHDFLPGDIVGIMSRFAGYDLVVNEDRNERDEYSFLQVYKKLQGTRREASYLTARPDKRLLLIRYGGIGDMIQTASVLPGLKAQGWHITMNTTPAGQQILQHDPHIDAWWIQDKNQIPNERLTEYWTHISREFDHTINLSESVEATLLAVPGRRTFTMSDSARRMMLDLNYQEFVHALADVPMPPQQRFYPTPLERRNAESWKQTHCKGRPLVLWPLAGSSIHKVWPWLDRAVSRVVALTDAVVVMTGDPASQILELATLQAIAKEQLGVPYEESDAAGTDKILGLLRRTFWQNDVSRIACLSGRMPIRETLALAQQADVVVGPETGILNAVAMEDEIYKIVMLSHSSANNLTKHWRNTVTVSPVDTPCFPCHRMHYNRDFCPQDARTGTALCASSISPDTIVMQIQAGLSQNRRAA